VEFWKNWHQVLEPAGMGKYHWEVIPRGIISAIKHDVETFQKKNPGQRYHLLDAGASPDAPLALHLKDKIDEWNPGKAHVTALDVAPQRFSSRKIKYIQGDVHAIPLNENSQHGVIASNVLEYAQNKHKALEQISKVLKQSGLLVGVVHAEDSEYPDFLVERAARVEAIVNALNQIQRLSRKPQDSKLLKSALDAVRNSPMAEGQKKPAAIVEYFLQNPDRLKVTQERFPAAYITLTRELGEKIKAGRFAGIEDIRQHLIPHGLDLEHYLKLRNGKDTFWMFTARKTGD